MATPSMKLQPQTPAVGIFASSQQRSAVVSLLLVLLSLVTYNPIARNGFVNWDDPTYILANPHTRSGLSWETIRWAFSALEAGNWHPLTWLSHALDCEIFGLRPAGHHYVNVLLHALVAILLYVFLKQATNAAGRSAAVAALFAVHPLNVESVAWAAERKNVLCTVFFLFGLCAYVGYARKPSFRRYSLVVLCFVLGLLSKPMVITFPFVLLLLDYWPLERMAARAPSEKSELVRFPARSLRQLVAEKLPLFLLSAASAVITVIAQKSGGALRYEYSFALRASNALVSYLVYLSKVIVPVRLAAIYPYPQNGVLLWKVAVAALGLGILTALVFHWREKRYLVLGWFWFLGTLVPVLGLLQVGEQSMADRYAYIPLVGVLVALVWGLADWAAAKRLSPRYLAAAMLVVIGSLAIVARTQMSYWQNSVTLWTHTLEVTGDNFVAQDNLGAELLSMAKVDEARQHLLAATLINPDDAFSQLDVGVCEKLLGNQAAALAHYKAALSLSSDPALRSTAFSNIGALYRRAGQYEAARENYEAALQLRPDTANSLVGLGLIAQRRGNLSEAARYFAEAANVQPSDVGYLLLSQALEKAGRTQEATAAREQAKRLSADLGTAELSTQKLVQE